MKWRRIAATEGACCPNRKADGCPSQPIAFDQQTAQLSVSPQRPCDVLQRIARASPKAHRDRRAASALTCHRQV